MIQGNVLSTNMLRSDYAETDPGKAGFILNKPDALIQSAKELAEGALPRTGGTMTGELNVLTPTEASHAASKDYVERYVASKHIFFDLVLSGGGWVGDVAPFTQTAEVAGILATDRPHYGPVYSEDPQMALQEKESWALVDDLNTAEGSVMFTCFEEKPVVDIAVQMEVNR